MDAVDRAVLCAALPQRQPARELLVHRRGETLDLRAVQIGRERERREPRGVEDLVRPGAPDPRDCALVAEQRVQASRVGAEDLAETIRRRGRAPPARGGRARRRPAPASAARRRRASSTRLPSAQAARRPGSRGGTQATSGPCLPRARSGAGRPIIRWTSRTSSPSSVGKSSRLARRSAPARRRPSSAESGGSNVFSVAMCAGPARSIGKARTGSSSSRRQASTSGNSGTGY